MNNILRHERVWLVFGAITVALMLWFELIPWWFPLVFLPMGFLWGFVEKRMRRRVGRNEDDDSRDRRA